MNFAILILTLLGILSDLIEFTYDAGAFTRTHILPGVIYTYVAIEHYSQLVWDKITTMEYNVKVYNTPLTTGLA